jgi:uncharacterized protein YciI
MLTIAFCQDSPRARQERQRQFAPHIQHLRNIMPGIRLAAPLATADGAAISDDDSLVASVFVLEAATVQFAEDLMRADPYTEHDVWRCISLFTADDVYGEWLSAGGLGKSPERIYVASWAPFDEPQEVTDDDHLAAGHLGMRGLSTTTLFGARLRYAGSIGDSALASRWRSVIFLAAESLAGASSRVAAQSKLSDGTGRTQVWAIPFAVGSWPGKTEL